MHLVDHIRYMLSVKFPPRLHEPTLREKRSIESLRQSILLINSNSFAKTPSERNWLNNSQRLTHLIHHNDPRRFLRWDVIASTMFVAYKPYLFQELDYLKKLTDWESRWKLAIRESSFGCPVPFVHYPKSSGNLIHQAYHLVQFEKATKLKIADLDFVLEFGGGYGSMRRLFNSLGFKGKYVIFDLPIFSALQRYYLESVGISVNAQQDKQTEAQTTLSYCLSDINDLKTILSPLKKNTESLFIAAWSLSETPVSLRNTITTFLKPFNNMLLAYQREFEEIDNRDYFSQFTKLVDGEMIWKNWEIPHLPANYYLMGTRNRE